MATGSSIKSYQGLAPMAKWLRVRTTLYDSRFGFIFNNYSPKAK